MGSFDAELYLRLLGEEDLLGSGERSRPPWESPLGDAAGALAAVGAIEEQTAASVLEDYRFAASLRGEDGFAHRMRRGSPTRREGRQLQAQRVIACDREIEIAGGTLHVRHIVLGADRAQIAVDFRRDASSAPGRRRHARFAGPRERGLPEVTVGDDHGTSAGTDFSGGGSELEWNGHLETHRPLAADAAWIEIAGQRIELDAEPLPVRVRLEPLGEQRPAERHLWRQIAGAGHFPHGAGERLHTAIDALIRAGALDADDPLLAQVRTVSAAMPDHPREPPGAAPTGGMPEPWRSMLARRGREDGPTGTIAIGAVTPIFDGHCVGLIALDSGPGAFTVEVQLTPGEAEMDPLASRDRLLWWAQDDRGNHHLGQMGEWSGDDEGSHGQIEFWPALDPRAQRLEVMPTAWTQRAVIALALRWARRDDGGRRAGDG